MEAICCNCWRIELLINYFERLEIRTLPMNCVQGNITTWLINLTLLNLLRKMNLYYRLRNIITLYYFFFFFFQYWKCTSYSKRGKNVRVISNFVRKCTVWRLTFVTYIATLTFPFCIQAYCKKNIHFLDEVIILCFLFHISSVAVWWRWWTSWSSWYVGNWRTRIRRDHE